MGRVLEGFGRGANFMQQDIIDIVFQQYFCLKDEVCLMSVWVKFGWGSGEKARGDPLDEKDVDICGTPVLIIHI